MKSPNGREAKKAKNGWNGYLMTFFAIMIGLVAIALIVGSCRSREKEKVTVESFALGEDDEAPVIMVGMTADEVFEILTPEDVLRQTMVEDPDLPGSLKINKLYRLGKIDFDFELEFRKKEIMAPYVLHQILLIER
jgi:hypothetical protein